jgi:hypothetical protein
MDNAGFGFSSQNAGGVMDTSHGAILYIFKPYRGQIGDVAMRPFQYTFDDNFLNDVEERMDLSSKGSARAATLVDNLMDSTNLTNYMMPSHKPAMTFHGNHLDRNYRFILIFTTKASSLNIGQTVIGAGSNAMIRRIYTGYFTDDPVNMATFSSNRHTLNPNAYMVITHKTIVNSGIMHNAYGSRSVLNTKASEEVVHGQISLNLTGLNGPRNDLYLMTPENCFNSIVSGDGQTHIAVPGAYSSLNGDKGANVVADVLEMPKHNVAQVVRGMIRYRDEVTTKEQLTMYRQDRLFDDELLDEAHHRMKIAGHMALPRSNKMDEFDLDLDRPVSPVDLEKLVNGDLQVMPFDLERPMFYETADQQDLSITNMYSSLIVSVICPLMSAAGLNAIQFTYEIADRQGQVFDDFIPVSAEPLVTISNPDVLKMVKAVSVELINGVFDVIFKSKGAFTVMVSANTTGMTIVRLSLIGMGLTNRVDFEIPSCMGGLISPLLGDAASNANNSEAVEGLYNTATGTRDFTENDKTFTNLAYDFANSNVGAIDTDWTGGNAVEID